MTARGHDISPDIWPILEETFSLLEDLIGDPLMSGGASQLLPNTQNLQTNIYLLSSVEVCVVWLSILILLNYSTEPTIF